ncbi:hypothetical protein [Streptomyces sp. NPDC094466]|uniref:hypothetical protein n=1 Tax=Streptomyces sp. NPDC094466 TaxID=3366065 RepID=UPI003807C0B8
MTDAPPLVLAAALLDALEPLPHTGRMRELAVRARRLAAQGSLRAVLDELEDGDPYERRIAVIAAAVGRDAEWIGARLADEDAVVRGHALRAARTLRVPDTAYESAFADASAAVRRHLARAIVADRRTALADRLVLDGRATRGDIEAARLLPGCSATTVGALRPELRRSTACWSSLGHHHPGPVLDSAEEELSGLPAAARPASAVLAAAGRTLAAHRDLVPDAVALLARSLDLAGDPDTLHTELVALAALHAGRPALAARTAATVGRRVVGYRVRRPATRTPCCSSSHGWRGRAIRPRGSSPPN